MHILFVSKNGLAADLAKKLKEEGNEVKLYIDRKSSKDIFSHIVPKTENWKEELDWVGRDGLIVFDDNGFGHAQDMLRKKGYRVFGGNSIADKLEYDREYSQKIFKKYGIKTFPLKTFNNVIEAAEYAIKHPDFWVIKREDDHTKFASYVGEDSKGRDVVALLRNLARMKKVNSQPVSLQKRIDGIEIGVGRYFNGKSWVGPIEVNIEHPHLFAGEVGPFTTEMGTLAWFTDKPNQIYDETLARLTEYLEEIEFKGNIAVNCIVNKTGIFALELTPRLGTPIVHLQSEMLKTRWTDLLGAVADGEDIKCKWKEGFGIVILIAVPPFPYNEHFELDVFKGLSIDMRALSKKDFSHLHFEEVSKINGKTEFPYYIADSEGYILYVTAVESTIKKAREVVNNIAAKIIIPKSFYRNDIGLKFENESLDLLKKWGYL